MRQSSTIFRLAARLARWRWYVSAGIVVLAASFVLVASTSTGADTDDRSLGNLLALIALGAIAVVAALSLVLQIAGVDAQAAEIADRLTADTDQRRLLTRWLERARWARFLGGFSGLVAWMFGTRADGNMFAWGFGGIAVGALAAEMHHLRRPTGPRTARLEVRRVSNYLWPFAAWHMVGTAAAGLVVATAAVVVDEPAAMRPALAATGVIAAGHLAQRRVASRPRPALADTLRSADDLTRELAIERNIAWPCTYFAMSLIGSAAMSMSDDVVLIAFLGIALHFYAIGLWWRNRRLGLDHLLHEQREPVLA